MLGHLLDEFQQEPGYTLQGKYAERLRHLYGGRRLGLGQKDFFFFFFF